MKIPLTFQFDQTKPIGFVEIDDALLGDPEIGEMIIAPAMSSKPDGTDMHVAMYGLIHISKALEPKS